MNEPQLQPEDADYISQLNEEQHNQNNFGSQTACWGTNKLERCGWISFGYGSIYDGDCFWISLDAAKALARFDYGPINLNHWEWSNKPDEYKNLHPRLRMTFSAWNIDVPGDKEESLRWWEEIEKEMGKHGLSDGKSHESLHEEHPEDSEIYKRCYLMFHRAEEARHGFMDVCHDETILNICTEDHRHPNGGGTYKQFMSEEEVLLTGDDDMDAFIIAKVVLREHLRVYGKDMLEGIGQDNYKPTPVDVTDINPFDPNNSTTMFVEKIEIEGTLFTVHLYEQNKMAYFRYTFDRSEAKPDWDYINTKKAQWEERKREEEKEAELEMLEWGETWSEMADNPKCRYKYNKNFSGNGLFDPEVYLPRKNFGFNRIGCPEKTSSGQDWYIFGGPLVVKEFVQSKGHGHRALNHECSHYRNYQCRPHDFFIFGGRIGAPEYEENYSFNKDYWQNPSIP